MIKGKANTAHCLRFPGDWYGSLLDVYHLLLCSKIETIDFSHVGSMFSGLDNGH